MKKNVIFDFDGTLVDSKGAINKLYEYFAKKYNISTINSENLESIKALPIMERMKKLGVPVRQLVTMSAEAKSVYSSFISEIKLKEGILDILKGLDKRQVNMFIISSNAAENIHKFLEINNLLFFKAVYSSKNILKKDNEIEKLLKKYKISKNDAIYIGDEVQDIIACRKINMEIISVPWGNDSLEALKESKPDYLCVTPEDLRKHLLPET